MQGVTDSAWFWASKQGSAQQMGEALKIIKQQNSLLKVISLALPVDEPTRSDFTPNLAHRCNLRQQDSSSSSGKKSQISKYATTIPGKVGVCKL
jgi:hypothetical protein